MIRTLYDRVGVVNFSQLKLELSAEMPIIDCNDVGGQIAIYTNSSPSQAFETIIQNHVPNPYPPLDSVGALVTLLVVLNVIPIQDAANVIHEEPEHLIAEAQAWSLG